MENYERGKDSMSSNPHGSEASELVHCSMEMKHEITSHAVKADISARFKRRRAVCMRDGIKENASTGDTHDLLNVGMEGATD